MVNQVVIYLPYHNDDWFPPFPTEAQYKVTLTIYAGHHLRSIRIRSYTYHWIRELYPLLKTTPQHKLVLTRLSISYLLT
mgnify:CR=1 FL=1